MFIGCSSLISITIPDNVTSIDEYAFSGCSSLISINLPNSVTSINYRAFNNCSSLTSITIPTSITYINDYIFNGCSSLTSITIPSSVIYIGYNSFSGCSSLNSLTGIKNDITYTYHGTFAPGDDRTIVLQNFVNNNDLTGWESDTIPPPPTQNTSIQTIRMSLFSNNAQVYYKPGSLASCGVGSTINSRFKSRRT